MSIFEVWMQWLDAFGGTVPFMIAMIVFLGGYFVISYRMPRINVGQRRALAIACLITGLMVGSMMGHNPTPEYIDHGQLKPALQEQGIYGDFSLVLASLFLALAIYYVSSKMLINRTYHSQNVAKAGAVISGVLFFIAGPQMTLMTAFVFGLVLFFLARFTLKLQDN
ncbi:hypothetical protein ACFL47_02780 [Candidatus Latescibacterota bacterium]